MFFTNIPLARSLCGLPQPSLPGWWDSTLPKNNWWNRRWREACPRTCLPQLAGLTEHVSQSSFSLWFERKESCPSHFLSAADWMVYNGWSCKDAQCDNHFSNLPENKIRFIIILCRESKMMHKASLVVQFLIKFTYLHSITVYIPPYIFSFGIP